MTPYPTVFQQQLEYATALRACFQIPKSLTLKDTVGESGVSPSWSGGVGEWGQKKQVQIIPIIPNF